MVIWEQSNVSNVKYQWLRGRRRRRRILWDDIWDQSSLLNGKTSTQDDSGTQVLIEFL